MAEDDVMQGAERHPAVRPDYALPGLITRGEARPRHDGLERVRAKGRKMSDLLHLAFARARVAFLRTPWEIDRIFGLGVFGLGIVFYLAPEQVVQFGFRFLAPIIHPVAWIVASVGFLQMLVGIMEWRRARQIAAFFCFFVYAAIAWNNLSPSGQWIYGVCALAEALIVLKRY